MTFRKRKVKKRFQIIISIILLLIVISFFLPSHVLRYFYWNFADLSDYKKFPSLEVKKGDSIFRFIPNTRNYSFEIPEEFNRDKTYENLETFLDKKETVAFLVIRNDTMIYEKYFEGYSDSSIIPCFSVAKSFVSALTGIAIEEGFIKNTSEPVTNYLNELAGIDGFDKITIENLLNMRSGIDFGENYSSPFADMAKYYYGTDLLKYIKELRVKEEPGKHYDYISVNALLLGLVIEHATGTKLNKYLEEKIWQPLEMESNASWSIDSKEDNTIKSFCCINGIARDFARFGRLYLHKGNWNGKQIVPAAWVERSTSIINDSRDSQGYPYTYFWRVLENGSFFAKGILGQYIFINPDKNLIFVRMGESYGDVDWAALFVELSKQL